MYDKNTPLILGIVREGKIPPERRVALLPRQCREIMNAFPTIRFIVQPSPFRCVPDEEYTRQHIEVQEDLSECEVLLGIKEVQVEDLLPDKTYFFFSHTIKKQAQNRVLLQTILANQIRLIDFECLVNPVTGERLIAFGRYAGIVGAYNAIWMLGKKQGWFDLKRAFECYSYAEMQQEYQKVKLPPLKIVLTGTGRVGRGAMEVLDSLGIRKVSATAFLEKTFQQAVYTPLQSRDYHFHRDDLPWDNDDFHKYPGQFESAFHKFTETADLLIATAFWHPKAPLLFSKADMQKPDFRIRTIADITCDLDGSIPATVQISTIQEPVYDFDPFSQTVCPPFSDLEKHISVMAIDNLPCEVPYDASEYFGRQFIEHILPHFFNGDDRHILQKATLTQNGKLTETFAYLEDWIKN
jgi:saccharopine dehydrogenase (NAD+, L-lysine forming)